MSFEEQSQITAVPDENSRDGSRVLRRTAGVGDALASSGSSWNINEDAIILIGDAETPNDSDGLDEKAAAVLFDGQVLEPFAFMQNDTQLSGADVDAELNDAQLGGVEPSDAEQEGADSDAESDPQPDAQRKGKPKSGIKGESSNEEKDDAPPFPAAQKAIFVLCLFGFLLIIAWVLNYFEIINLPFLDGCGMTLGDV